MEPGPRTVGVGALQDVGRCPEQPLEPDSVEGRVGSCPHRDSQQRDGCKHADTLKAQKSPEGGWVGAGQDQTVLNSFSLKSFLGLQFFFFLYFHFFLKSYENEQVDCGL